MKSHFLSFLSFLKNKKTPTKDDLAILREPPFSFVQILLGGSLILSIALGLSFLMRTSRHFSIEVPDYGGEVVEGVIGAPRYINPLLASSETDQALTTLVYSSLMKKEDDGSLSPFLASSCVSTPDERSYECTLPDTLTFSNKSPLTGADVLFTYETKRKVALSRDPQSDWGTISVEAPTAETVRITTTGPSQTLKEKMTLGIVPKALWSPVPEESLTDSTLNMAPIGSGPFIVNKIKITDTIPTEVLLSPNPQYSTKPFLQSLSVKSFSNQLDLKANLVSGVVTSTSALRDTFVDDQIKNDFSITQIPTNKTVALFMNPNQKGTPVAQTLALISPYIDRNKIIDTIENGYGIPLSEEPPHSDLVTPKITPPAIPISIAVQKDDDLITTAELLSTALKDFGILSTVNVFDQGIFTDQVSLGGYSFVIGTSLDTTSGYQRLIPLYTKTLVHITRPGTHTGVPARADSLHETFRDAQRWYNRTDLVWKWFIHNT